MNSPGFSCKTSFAWDFPNKRETINNFKSKIGANINIKLIKTKLMLSKVIFSLTVKFKGVDRNKLLSGRNMREARKKCLLPLAAPGGRGGNLNCKFKTIGFLDTLKVYSPITLQVLLYLSFKQNLQKKLQANVLHSAVSDFKSVKALSSRRGHCPPPLYTPLVKSKQTFRRALGTIIIKQPGGGSTPECPNGFSARNLS